MIRRRISLPLSLLALIYTIVLSLLYYIPVITIHTTQYSLLNGSNDVYVHPYNMLRLILIIFGIPALTGLVFTSAFNKRMGYIIAVSGLVALSIAPALVYLSLNIRGSSGRGVVYSQPLSITVNTVSLIAYYLSIFILYVLLLVIKNRSLAISNRDVERLVYLAVIYVAFAILFTKIGVGASMYPVIKNGDLVIYNPFTKPSIGDIAVLDNGYIHKIVGYNPRKGYSTIGVNNYVMDRHYSSTAYPIVAILPPVFTIYHFTALITSLALIIYHVTGLLIQYGFKREVNHAGARLYRIMKTWIRIEYIYLVMLVLNIIYLSYIIYSYNIHYTYPTIAPVCINEPCNTFISTSSGVKYIATPRADVVKAVIKIYDVNNTMIKTITVENPDKLYMPPSWMLPYKAKIHVEAEAVLDGYIMVFTAHTEIDQTPLILKPDNDTILISPDFPVKITIKYRNNFTQTMIISDYIILYKENITSITLHTLDQSIIIYQNQ